MKFETNVEPLGRDSPELLVQDGGANRGEQICHLEVEGYVILPGLLNANQVSRLKSQVVGFETTHVDYSVNQRGCSNIQFSDGAISDLIAFPAMVEFIVELCGDVVVMSCDYGRSEPGHPGISLHCDGQPWGSNIFNTEYTSPKLLRVLYYLDDLSPETYPFRVIPRSHWSYHNQANPYLRYKEYPEEVMVTCSAGSAVVFSNNAFHGNYPDVGDRARGSIQLSYRPTWAGPAEPVKPWDPDEVVKLPEPGAGVDGRPQRPHLAAECRQQTGGHTVRGAGYQPEVAGVVYRGAPCVPLQGPTGHRKGAVISSPYFYTKWFGVYLKSDGAIEVSV